MKKISMMCLFILGFLLISSLKAQNNPPKKTLSPFFWIKSKNKNVESLPLKSTSADVNIAGVIADVRITQEYQNTGKEPIEAVYIFPASTKAAVYAMMMTVGNRKLVAKIEEKNKARTDYEQAKAEGKTASLLEQQNPNVFQMNVANILPNDKILVELRYTELLVPTESVYEFVLPTVVGPRYSETLKVDATEGEKWVENPYSRQGKEPTYQFSVKTKINAGLLIQEIICETHKTNINFLDTQSAHILLDKSEKTGGNRDFIVKYRLAGSQVQSGLLLYEGENAVASADDKFRESESEKFFLLMMQPPKVPSLDQIPPREYVFIVDVSGSMHGFPLETSKILLNKLISNLRPTDKFNVMLFESSNKMLSPESMFANKENITKALNVLSNVSGGGGTSLMPALQNAFNFKETQNFSRSFIVITDGYVTVEREAFELIRTQLNKANLFAFGIGSSINRYLIEGMAHAGQGEPFFVINQNEAENIGQKFINYIQNPVLTNIKVEYEDFEAYDVEPVSIPDVFAERPIIVYGKFKNKPTGKIKLTGLSGNKIYSQTIDVKGAAKDNNQALQYLWARNKIMMLDDYQRLYPNEEQTKLITNLGLKYNLLTEYTSFIAIDSEVRNKEGKNIKVKQVLPLPAGVSDYSIGTESDKLQEVVITQYKGNKNKERKVKRENIKSAETQNAGFNHLILPKKIESIEESTEIKPNILDTKMTIYEPSLSLTTFINDNFALKNPTKQKINVSFEMDENGQIIHCKIKKNTDKNLENEICRILQLSKANWIQATKKGKKIKSKVSFEVELDIK
ncbi:MAG: VWA domain-containing protein [Bacteroidetes bacterium]|nr:MAG: VWA domain-containing protein [Bacteroidota bacterium]TAG88566.1 MAG: VWA domain-containing protein [Bacteroidota bacterium]